MQKVRNSLLTQPFDTTSREIRDWYQFARFSELDTCPEFPGAVQNLNSSRR